MTVQVKICGLSTKATLEAALSNGADLVGFVFYPPSPRSISLDQARDLAKSVPDNVKKVALIVDANDALLDGIVEALDPDMIQAHGHETPARISELKARYRRPVIKAITISGRQDLAAMRDYENIADFVLFDAKAPDDLANALPGGNGLTFDWRLISGHKPNGPFILSGGLNSDNVSDAIRITGADIVDISSGVESRPGLKDEGMIKNFLVTAKGARG